jgi:triosephosphate isomerase (TIM)
MKKQLIVANWKMEKTHNESIDWLKSHLKNLDEFKCACKNTDLIICPTFTALEKMGDLLNFCKNSCADEWCKCYKYFFTGIFKCSKCGFENNCECGCDFCESYFKTNCGHKNFEKNSCRQESCECENKNFHSNCACDKNLNNGCNNDNDCKNDLGDNDLNNINNKESFQIKLGAQNCSCFAKGAYTGEVSVQTLKELNCTYCIVGHSERRRFLGETNEMVAQKVKLLLEHEIVPIICIGESTQDHENNQVIQKLEKQLAPVIDIIKNNIIKTNICFGYEPWWAVGTNILPKTDELEKIFSWLNQYLCNNLGNNFSSKKSSFFENILDKNKKVNSKNILEKKISVDKNLNSCDSKINFLYGGSVNSSNIQSLKNIKFIDGFIIGKASLDLESVKKLCAH